MLKLTTPAPMLPIKCCAVLSDLIQSIHPKIAQAHEYIAPIPIRADSWLFFMPPSYSSH